MPSYKTLSSFRWFAVGSSLTLGAVLTTPEIVTQVVMALMIYAAFEAWIWGTWLSERRKRQSDQNLPS